MKNLTLRRKLSRPRMLPDWQAVLKRAWCLKWIGAAGLLTGLEAAMPFFIDQMPWSRRTGAIVVFLLVCGAFVARLLAQAQTLTKGEEQPWQ